MVSYKFINKLKSWITFLLSTFDARDTYSMLPLFNWLYLLMGHFMVVLSSYSGVLTKLCQLSRADLNETKRMCLKEKCVLQAANPFFKLLTMLMEFAGGPPGMPPFASYILQRIWEVSFEVHVSNLLFSQRFSSCCCFDFVVVVV